MYCAQLNKNSIYVLVAVIAAGIFSCEKKEVDFGGNTLTQDPNIVTVDTIGVNAFTTQVDSFSTVNSGYFVAGNHYDSVLGNFQSTAYFDLNIPYDTTSTLKNCTGCYFDSLVVTPKFSGGYYGDTSSLFILNVNQLTELVSDGNTFGFNTTSRNYNATPLGSFSAVISPSKQNTIRIRLPGDFGKDLFDKVQRNSDTVTNSEKFLNYIKGFCFTSNPNSNTVYYMKPVADSDFMLLYYHKNAPLPVNYIVKFPLNTAHQFNGYATDYAGTDLTAFTPGKQQTVAGNQTNGYVYADANRGLNSKFNFPSLYSLKEIILM